MIDELSGVRVFVSDVRVGDDRDTVQLIERRKRSKRDQL